MSVMAAPDLDLDAALAIPSATIAEDQKREPRWLSTSTADSDLDLNNFWVSEHCAQPEYKHCTYTLTLFVAARFRMMTFS